MLLDTCVRLSVEGSWRWLEPRIMMEGRMAAALPPPLSVPRVRLITVFTAHSGQLPTLPHIASANPGKVTGERSPEPGWAVPGVDSCTMMGYYHNTTQIYWGWEKKAKWSSFFLSFFLRQSESHLDNFQRISPLRLNMAVSVTISFF